MSLRKINETTFEHRVKDDPRDRIKAIIGDDKQPDFKPQFKISRWDNEVNFSIRAKEYPNARIEVDGDIIKYISPECEVHLYDKPKAGEDGGFEFEWVLLSKPSSNVLEATIQTKALSFFYQGELSAKDIAEGILRPENVIGSYAAYHKTKGRLNCGNEKDYKTGKAFHIYRPKIIDAKGSEIWGILSIDSKKGLLTVTIDEEWLDNAIYPIIVDPTFGYTSAGASTLSIEGFVRGSRFTMPEDGTGDSMTIYSNPSDTGRVWTGNIYDNGSGDADASVDLIANGVTNEHTPSATGADWRTSNFVSSPTLVNGAAYRIMVAGSAGTGTHLFHFDDPVSGHSSYAQAVTYPTFPDPSNHGSILTDRVYSIYITYTATGGVETPKRRSFLVS